MNNELKFNEQDWNGVSSVLKDLITKMLDRNPETRIKSNEILNHKLFNKLQNKKEEDELRELSEKEANLNKNRQKSSSSTRLSANIRNRNKESNGQQSFRSSLNPKYKNVNNYKQSNILTPVNFQNILI